MIVEYALRDAILADSTILGLVGSRFYPVDAVPQDNTLPTVLTYQRISTAGEVLLDGEEAPERVRIQLNCLASTRLKVRALTTEIRRFFNGGYSGSGIQLARLDGDGDLPKEPESKLYGSRVDVLVTIAAAEAA